MRYPIWRRNTDGTEVVVRNPEEAYANPETIAAFLPSKPVPEPAETPTVDPEPEVHASEPEVVPEPAETRRGPGRPRKDS